MVETEELFLMANLPPRRTGLPFVVWISPRGNARHDVRIKVSPGPRASLDEMISVGIRPDVHIIQGDLNPQHLRLLKRWVDLNRSVLIDYWNGDIEFTEEALEALVGI